MKTLILILTLILLTGLIFAAPSLQAGLGGSFMPGQYDYSILSNYVDQKNNNGIQNLDPSEITPVPYYGANIFASAKMFNFLIRIDASISFPGKITVTYNDVSTGTVVPYSIEHKALLASGTLWLGPVFDFAGPAGPAGPAGFAGRGSVYLCTGPSFMYGEWRDKCDVTDNTSRSKDRQYTGTGVVFPVMLGGESLITEKIGISLEVIVIAQAILLETFSKDNLDATDNTANIITFPIGSGFMGTSISPAVFKTQLSVIYHIM